MSLTYEVYKKGTNRVLMSICVQSAKELFEKIPDKYQTNRYTIMSKEVK